MNFKDIIIPQDVRDLVLLPLGAPFLTEEDFREIMPEHTGGKDVIQIIINKAIRLYNTKNPLKVKQQHSVVLNDNCMEIDYPESAIGLVNTRQLTIRGAMTPGYSGNTFANLASMRGNGISSGRMYGTRYNLGVSPGHALLNKATAQGLRDSVKTLVVDNDQENKKVRIWTNMGSRLVCTWIMRIERWQQIGFNYQDLVIDMASGMLLQYIGDLIEMEDIGDLSVEINGKRLVEKGDKLVADTLAIWNTYPQITSA